MLLSLFGLGLTTLACTITAATLGSYNVDPNSVSVSGLSSGGYLAAQLGIAYSSIFKTGFGVFAGGPFDCARAQSYSTCMNNNNPSITAPIANMKSWSGNQIDTVGNLQNRKIYMQVGTADTTVGPNVMNQLKSQLANFGSASNTTFITTNAAAHTFPTDFAGAGDNACGSATSPYVSNCGYDGAGAVLTWMYGTLNARNTGQLSGAVTTFSQTGSYGASGMDTIGYLYVPAACQSGSVVCRLHVALHGCLQSYSQIGSKFIVNTGYTLWADTNSIIVLFPQTIADNSIHTIWSGTLLPNPNACWDWVGWYGQNADQKGGVQMVAILNQVNQILSGYNGGSGPSTTSSRVSSTLVTSSTRSSSSIPATGTLAPLYGQCAGIGWTGPTACAAGTCTSYSPYYGQCL